MPENPNGPKITTCVKCGQVKPHHAKQMCQKCYKRLYFKPKMIICKNCGRERPHKAYGLCGTCHIKQHHYETTKAFNYRKWHNISLELYRQKTKKCFLCGFDKIVELHHIDSDHKNNAPDNFMGLCPNHHKMLHDIRYSDEIKKQIEEKLKKS